DHVAAILSNLDTAGDGRVKHHCKPVSTCNCADRLTDTSMVTRAVRRRPPLCASLYGSRIRSTAPQVATKMGDTPPASVVNSALLAGVVPDGAASALLDSVTLPTLATRRSHSV